MDTQVNDAVEAGLAAEIAALMRMVHRLRAELVRAQQELAALKTPPAPEPPGA